MTHTHTHIHTACQTHGYLPVFPSYVPVVVTVPTRCHEANLYGQVPVQTFFCHHGIFLNDGCGQDVGRGDLGSRNNRPDRSHVRNIRSTHRSTHYVRKMASGAGKVVVDNAQVALARVAQADN